MKGQHRHSWKAKQEGEENERLGIWVQIHKKRSFGRNRMGVAMDGKADNKGQ